MFQLKKPQKPDKTKRDEVTAWMHFVCKFIYYWCGLGDCWYEQKPRSALQNLCYRTWSVVNLGTIMATIVCEISALFQENLTTKERHDAFQFGTSQILIVMKWMCIVYYKQRIRQLLKNMLVDSRELFTDEQIEREQVATAKKYCFALGGSIFAVCVLTTMDAFVNYFKTGTPWRTLVTVYPTHDDLSYLAFFTRGVTTLLWYHIVTAMCAADFIAITNLVYMSYKYRILQQYFKNLKKNFEKNSKFMTQSQVEEDMYSAFVKGIKLHKEVLWCTKNIQTSLGNVYSFQVTQSVLLLVNCLAKLVTTQRSLPNFFAITSVIVVTLVLTGVYMWTAGEITYQMALQYERAGSTFLAKDIFSLTDGVPQASFLGDAIFESGWHLCGTQPGLRKLVVVSLMQSHIPVVMTAFGVMDLSYENFIKVIRSFIHNITLYLLIQEV